MNRGEGAVGAASIPDRGPAVEPVTPGVEPNVDRVMESGRGHHRGLRREGYRKTERGEENNAGLQTVTSSTMRAAAGTPSPNRV